MMRIARVGLHAWEEPPISGSAGSGTIFFSGCSLSCIYCQNARISRRACGRPYEPDELAQACLELQRAGAMNINLVTPTHFAPGARAAIDLARAGGLRIPVVWNTSGYERVEAIEANRGTADVYLTDFKYADARLAGQLSGVPDYPAVALAAIEVMVEQAGPPAYDRFGGEDRMIGGVVVRHLVLPGQTRASMEAVQLVHEAFGSQVRLSIMSQYTPPPAGIAGAAGRADRFPELARTLSEQEYEAVLDHADAIGVQDYFWQQGEAASESFIPDFCCEESAHAR